jgi:hypothetical protein
VPSSDYATRLFIARQLRDLTANGASLRAACARLNVALATGKLWLDKLASGADLADARRERSGRKPVCPLTEREAAALRSLVMERRMTEDSAIRAFIKHPACRPETREFITRRLHASHSAPRHTAKKERWPDSLRRAMHVTAGDKARYYGKDATRKANIHAVRNMDIVMPDGRTVQLRPHMMWQFDDYSTNKPYYLEYAEGQFRCCRQVLAAYDTFTGGWLCFLHVGKERDQYTGGDCLRVAHLAMESHGTKPQLIIFEKGRWASDAVQGLAIPGTSRRWGALSECGVIVHHAADSNGKAEIEGAFRTLQTELAGGADIGHTRGLHELESDNYQLVNKGRRDPRHCGFLSLSDSEEEHYRAAALLNSRRRERRCLGYASADELFAEFPVEKNPLKPEERWLFLPHKQEATVGSISSGLVGCKVNDRRYLFVVNGIAPGVHLDNGHRVFIAFDPERPWMGCAVGNADTSTKNRDEHRLGALLLGGTAPMAPAWDDIPRLDLRSPEEKRKEDNQHWKLRKGAITAADSSFRAILPGGKRGLRAVSRKTRSGDVRDAVIGSEHDDSNAAAELTQHYRGEAPGMPGHSSPSPESAEMPPRPPRNGLPARGSDSSGIQSQNRAMRPERISEAVPSDTELEALEAAAMRAAGLVIS